MLARIVLAAALSLPPNSPILLRSGNRLETVGAVTEKNGQLLFRVEGGSLYSIPLGEVDVDATRAAAQRPAAAVAAAATPLPPARLKASEEDRRRLLKDLESNHSGKPAPLAPLPPLPADPAAALRNPDEWAWRNRARSLEEGVRQAEENLQLLTKRAEQLKAEIAGFLSLGFNPRQFTYQTTQLQYVQEQIPYAQLEVQRAKRAQEQFREDARKQGILPGWLRN